MPATFATAAAWTGCFWDNEALFGDGVGAAWRSRGSQVPAVSDLHSNATDGDEH